MPASPQDFYKKVGANTVTTLAAPGKNLAATSINVGSTTNYPTDTGIVVGIRVVDSNGTIVPGTYTEWNAVVASSTAITIEAVPVYGTDQVYPAGSLTQVFLMVSSSLHNQMVDGLLVSHDQDGKLKAGAISNSNMFANSVIPTAAYIDASVTYPKLATGTVIATAIKTSSQARSSTDTVQVTDLTATFSVPAGGMNVKISTCIPEITANTGLNTPLISIVDGTVGSGTVLAYWRGTIHTTGYLIGAYVQWYGNLSAGSHTINVGVGATLNNPFTLMPLAGNQANLIIEKA